LTHENENKDAEVQLVEEDVESPEGLHKSGVFRFINSVSTSKGRCNKKWQCLECKVEIWAYLLEDHLLKTKAHQVNGEYEKFVSKERKTKEFHFFMCDVSSSRPGPQLG
jgi:hypothetical protein